MIDFKTATPDVHKLDPLKRVKYSFGLVLGVDEFLQEQTHLLEKHRRHNRTLHAHGTVWGLRVWVPPAIDPPEVRVEPGLAVTPSGHEICVPTVMCAKIDEWLRGNSDARSSHFGPPPYELPVCVVLCYRECATDIVPVPGEPCRSEAETMSPSRIADSFELMLCLHDIDLASPPGDLAGLCHCPVHASRTGGTRELGLLLRRIEITTIASSFATREEIEAEVRNLANLDSWSTTSPPGGALAVRPEDVRDRFQAIARTWVTEVLPILMERDGQACCAASGEKCVVLAELRIQVSAINTVLGGASGITVDDAERPVLLATAVLQEWLLSGGPVVVP